MITYSEEIQDETYGEEIEDVDSNLPLIADGISDDSALWKDDVQTLTKHNEQYTKLLEAYVENIKEVLADKRQKKEQTYRIAFGLMIAIPICVIVIIIIALLLGAFCTKVDMIDLLPEIVAAMGVFITTLITIPNLISEYLFNKEEEQAMSSIIAKIQDYDIQVRKKE